VLLRTADSDGGGFGEGPGAMLSCAGAGRPLPSPKRNPDACAYAGTCVCRAGVCVAAVQAADGSWAAQMADCGAASASQLWRAVRLADG
jgi:hypothetical protein